MTFAQLTAEPFRYHDAIRFANGQEILLQKLSDGLRMDAVPGVGRRDPGSETRREVFDARTGQRRISVSLSVFCLLPCGKKRWNAEFAINGSASLKATIRAGRENRPGRSTKANCQTL